MPPPLTTVDSTETHAPIERSGIFCLLLLMLAIIEACTPRPKQTNTHTHPLHIHPRKPPPWTLCNTYPTAYTPHIRSHTYAHTHTELFTYTDAPVHSPFTPVLLAVPGRGWCVSLGFPVCCHVGGSEQCLSSPHKKTLFRHCTVPCLLRIAVQLQSNIPVPCLLRLPPLPSSVVLAVVVVGIVVLVTGRVTATVAVAFSPRPTKAK
jgi:hypothetical protein